MILTGTVIFFEVDEPDKLDVEEWNRCYPEIGEAPDHQGGNQDIGQKVVGVTGGDNQGQGE